MIDYKNNKVTWQAATIKKVNEQCLLNNKYPNGQILNESDKIKLKQDIQICTDILINYGCIDNQIKLEF